MNELMLRINPPFQEEVHTSAAINYREVKQNFLSNVPAADSHPNYFGMPPSYW